jgi:hypothetical protein
MTKIRVRGVTGTLFKIGNSPHWRLYFRHPQDRQRQRISLGTPDRKVAETKSKNILSEALESGLKTLKTHARRETSPRVGKAVDHYLQVSKCLSKKVNANCLLRVLRVAKELVSKDEARDLPLTALTDKLVGDYVRKAKIGEYSKRSCLASARCVFVRLQDWHDFQLPDLSGFLAASSKTGIKSPSNSFKHIPKDVLAQMETDSRAKGGAYRRAFILCRYLGVTPKEVSFARKSWLEERGGKTLLCLRERSEENFTLKTGALRERDIVLAPWMAEELRTADDYIVSGHTPYLRLSFMLRQFNDWVREYIPDRKGAAYELRKQAGSDWLESLGKISLVSHLLGHSTPQTTAKWYATWERAVEVPEVFAERPS